MIDTALLHDPVTWISLAFLLVVGAMVKSLVPVITRALDDRALIIRQELDRATQLREEAQAVLAQYQKKQRESLREAEEIVQKANLEARRITTEAEMEVEASLKKRMKLAVDKIEQAERQALNDVQARIIDITVAATRQIIEGKLDAAAREELVKSAAQDIEKKLH